ncbi:hypothetical protein ACHAXS_006626, partial [Conticribra weissflogii]
VLQTALDNTLGSSLGKALFERREDTEGLSVGIVTSLRSTSQLVYSGEHLSPDISKFEHSHRRFWVEANSVWRKQPVIRRVTLEELFAIWDYEAKLNNVDLTIQQRWQLLSLRLASPPGKILRAFTFHGLQTILDRHYLHQEHKVRPATLPQSVGPTQDVSFSVLELTASARLTAALPDHAEVDLSQWELPGKTPRIGEARAVLRRFAVRWWKYYKHRTASMFLAQPGSSTSDEEGVKDCLRRIHACEYWKWNRGSRLFFWELPKEFIEEFRDGSKLWHLTDGPSGYLHNTPTSTREAELELRAKVLKLCFQWYCEPGYVKLVIPQFAVEKPGDIRCVFDSKKNGRNATLWAPSFMLPTSQDAEDLVIKWLSIPVEAYLDAGSPVQDYTTDQPMIITYSGDINVGQMFHNFLVHPSERCHLGVRLISTRNDGGVLVLRKDGELATRKATFVDDIHVVGRGGESTLRACKRLKSKMNSVGNQADDRKYRRPCTTPGAWNGVLIHTNTPFPMKSTTGKKWLKFKRGIQWVLEEAKHQGSVETRKLRSVAGLGVNVSEVYPEMRPYLKGFFNALEAFRQD